jgi:hypothetical protein
MSKLLDYSELVQARDSFAPKSAKLSEGFKRMDTIWTELSSQSMSGAGAESLKQYISATHRSVCRELAEISTALLEALRQTMMKYAQNVDGSEISCINSTVLTAVSQEFNELRKSFDVLQRELEMDLSKIKDLLPMTRPQNTDFMQPLTEGLSLTEALTESFLSFDIENGERFSAIIGSLQSLLIKIEQAKASN